MIESTFKLTVRQFQPVIELHYLDFLNKCKETIASLVAITSFNRNAEVDMVSFEDRYCQERYLLIRDMCSKYNYMYVLSYCIEGLSDVDRAFFNEFSSRVDYFYCKSIREQLLNYVSITMDSSYRIDIRNVSKVRLVKELHLQPQHIQGDRMLGV